LIAVSVPDEKVQGGVIYDNLMAQSKNGSGKTGAFCIGSALRVDQKVEKL